MTFWGGQSLDLMVAIRKMVRKIALKSEISFSKRDVCSIPQQTEFGSKKNLKKSGRKQHWTNYNTAWEPAQGSGEQEKGRVCGLRDTRENRNLVRIEEQLLQLMMWVLFVGISTV